MRMRAQEMRTITGDNHVIDTITKQCGEANSKRY